MNKDIVVVADPQMYEGAPTEHLAQLSKFLWKHKPSSVVHIGDHFDFPSLSFYSSAIEREGRRLKSDLEAGFNSLDLITDFVDERNLRAKGKVVYKPKKYFCMGNHEFRLNRYIDSKPELEGIFDLKGDIEKKGWEVYDYLNPLWLQEICFIHYMPNAHSGKPVGGGIENKLNKFPHSFVQGHVQIHQFGRRQNLQGKPHFGAVAGSFYQHDEGYRGACNTEARGFLHLKHFVNRYGFDDYGVEFVNIEHLLSMEF